MAAGQFVFPAVMAAFLLLFLAFLASVPATPAPEAPESRLLRARPGDSVLLELTGYYGESGSGFVFFSTQEERHAALPRGDFEPTLQSAPVTYPMRADATGGLDGHLVGRRAGESFTTGPIEARFAFGDWIDERELPRTLAELPYEVTFDSQTQVGPGQTFRVADFVQFWSQRGHDLREGAIWPCEGDELWDCQVVRLSTDENVLTYRRLVTDGSAFPVAPVFADLPLGGEFSWDFTVQPGSESDRFSVRLDPPDGARFQFRANAGGPFRAGTYEVLGSDADSIQVRYSSVTASDPALVGREVYYDVVIVRITRPES